CFDPDLYPDMPSPHRGLVLKHIGSFYGLRGPTAFLRALEKLRATDAGLLEDVRIEFVGDASARLKQEIGAMLGEMRLGGIVQIRPGVGYFESLREMRESDALILIEAPAATNLFLPSKLIDYL